MDRSKVCATLRTDALLRAAFLIGMPELWHGGGCLLYISARMPTFYDKFVACSERWPQNTAVEIQRPDGLESHTYTELRRMAESFGAWLLTRGMPPGSPVAILADNHPRWVAGYLGIIAAGGVAVPLDTAYHADQIAKLLKDSGTALLVCDAKQLGTAQEAVAGADVDLVLTAATPAHVGTGVHSRPATKSAE